MSWKESGIDQKVELELELELVIDVYISLLRMGRMKVMSKDKENSSNRERLNIRELTRNHSTIDYATFKRILEDDVYRYIKGYMEWCDAQDIRILSWRDRYLRRLLGPYCPTVLYVSGDISVLDRPVLGIVGSRDADDYGKGITAKVISSLKDSGAVFTTVSGGARGIDTACHRASLENSVPTVAVLGGGHRHIYPPENRDLFFRIIDSGGAVISEYPPDIRPRRHFFPERNRIIAGLSDLLFIPQAGMKSGSMHTAETMVGLDRPVVTVPHDIGRINGAGCNMLIAFGADFLMDINEIRNYFPTCPSVDYK